MLLPREKNETVFNESILRGLLDLVVCTEFAFPMGLAI